MAKIATATRHVSMGWEFQVWVYRMSPPYHGNQYVAVVGETRNGYQRTLIHPSNELGEHSSEWLPGSFWGDVDHRVALKIAGYKAQ